MKLRKKEKDRADYTAPELWPPSMAEKLLFTLELVLLTGMLVLSFYLLYSYFEEGEQAVNGTAVEPEDAAKDATGNGTEDAQQTGAAPERTLLRTADTESLDIRVRILDNAYTNDVFETITVCGSQGIFAEAGTYGEDYSFSAAGQSAEPVSDEDTISRIRFAEPDTAYTVTAADLQETEVLRLSPGDGGVLTVSSLERADGAPEYAGELLIYRLQEGLALVNVLPLEEYLYSVVSSEMPSYFPEEAQKAQAVCARTYALLCLGCYESQADDNSSKEEGLDSSFTLEGVLGNEAESETEDGTENEKKDKMIADLDDSVKFQVYNNRKYTEISRKAVDATAQVVLTADEVLYYSTSCLSEDRADLDQESAFREFLQQVPEGNAEYGSAWLRWSVTIPVSRILDKLAEEYEIRADVLEQILVAGRSESGQAQLLRVVADGKTLEIEGEYAIRQFLSPDGEDVTLMDGTTAADLQLLPSAFFYIEAEADILNLSGEADTGDYEFPTETNSPEQETSVPEASDDLLLGKDAVLYIYGGGCGHGTGMSQYGAAQMAADGASYTEILEYYYNTGDE